MKIVVDENLPPALARALDALFAGEHTIVHLRDRYGPGVTDLTWIPELGQEGNWIVLSGDRGIRRKRAEFQAFKASRLIGFFLSAGLNKAPLVKKAERILALWPAIETFASRAAPGAMFELPMTSTRIGTL
ncbi:PIN-like domain-containing protein [Methylobacterium sp. A54F]